MKTRRRNRANRRPILTPIILVVALICFIHTHLLGQPTRQIVHAQTATATAAAISTPTATPTPTPTEHDQIVSYIKQVFGKDSDKALELLTSPTCHENRTLDPDATHPNGNGTTDWGLFQIDDFWQGFDHTSVRFLKNYRINTLIAKQLFDEGGGSFRRWTCGQALGI